MHTFVVVFTIICCGEEERTYNHGHKISAFLFVIIRIILFSLTLQAAINCYVNHSMKMYRKSNIC